MRTRGPACYRRGMRPRLAPVAALLLLAGCPVDPVVPDTPPAPYTAARTVDRLVVNDGPMLDLPRGEVVELGLSAWFDGATESTDVTAAASWQVADPLVATVDEDGAITGVAEGSTTAWGVYAGIPSEPVAVQVTRGLWNVDFVDGGTGVQGKLLDVELSAADTTFESATTVEFTIDGLLPFGMDRTEDPWWGVGAAPNRYVARFLVPPTATPGAHTVNVAIDGRPPENALSVQITANTAFGEVRGCDYFASDPASNWTFQADGNNTRTWLVGSLDRNSNTHISAMSATPGDVDAWLGLWSLTGELLATSDDDPSLGGDDAGVQVTSLEDVFDGAFYVTASISPKASVGTSGGSMVTDCAEEVMPDPQLDADNATTLFGTEGATIFAGDATEVATFTSALGGTVARAWVYLDVEITQPDNVTFTLTSPSGTEVELLNPQWGLEYLRDGAWAGAVGGPAPFILTADEFTNPTTSDGTLEFAGESASGAWTVSAHMNAVGTGGTWHDALLFIDTD